MLASIVIRTLNEAKYLDDLLTMVEQQQTSKLAFEVVLVDSGSTDGTIEIAKKHACQITTISKQEFSFGRSLNRGCDLTKGDILIFISGHCIPENEFWLQALCQPLIDGHASYSYGRQIGDDDSNYSERRIFAKYYPIQSKIPQHGFFCNNANAALLRSSWAGIRFDEELTGLEDMAMAKHLVEAGQKIAYVADATVFHHHSETWAGVQRRFEREAIALQQIMPEVHISRFDVLRYIFSSVLMDWKSALRHSTFLASWSGIIYYRASQYVGSYKGNNDQRRLSRTHKERFFYPSVNESDADNEWFKSHRRTSPHESKQSEGEG